MSQKMIRYLQLSQYNRMLIYYHNTPDTIINIQANVLYFLLQFSVFCSPHQKSKLSECIEHCPEYRRGGAVFMLIWFVGRICIKVEAQVDLSWVGDIYQKPYIYSSKGQCYRPQIQTDLKVTYFHRQIFGDFTVLQISLVYKCL